MHKWRTDAEWKYLRIEILFFVIFFYVFPILTEVEYSYNEMHNVRLFTQNIDFHLVYGTTSLLPGLVFYAIVRRSLIAKKPLLFALYTILLLICMHYYMEGVYVAVAHIEWLPEKLRDDALRWSEANVIHFSVIYMCRQFLCIGALAYFIYSAKQDDQMRKLKEQQLLTELTYLKAQLHPHFFFNTMNNIYSLALKSSADTAPLVARLADMMRYILYEAEQVAVPLSKEIQFLTNYIDAEKIRHHGNNQINFDVQGIKPNAMIEPLLLLPFIENAFKHGLHEETGNGFVHIVICQSDTELIVQISNSKPIQPKENQKGIGLQNAIKRLNLLYAGRHVMNIKDDTNVYQLNLSLQIND
jgi:two-component system, LytTR family, sensor kinase